jgi:Uma2 family endonuclease
MAATLVKRRFTVDEYHRMGQVGILPERERVELIDGEVLAMTPVGARHGACVASANRALVKAAGNDAIVQPQGATQLNLFSEPQPDIMLLRPRDDFYAAHHPGPEDVLLVVEIADSSLDYDRGVKARLYAAAGIQEYWLADLKANILWRLSSPDRGTYRGVEPCHRGRTIAPGMLPSCIVATDVFLVAPSEA